MATYEQTKARIIQETRNFTHKGEDCASSIHVGISYLPNGKIDMTNSDNGIVYSPRYLFLYDPDPEFGIPQFINSGKLHYFNFFNDGRSFRCITIYTSIGPSELLDRWEREHRIKPSVHLGNVLGLFKATEEQAKALLEDLVENPTKYIEHK